MELLLPLAGVIIGGLLTLAGTIWTTIWSAKVSATARKEERMYEAMDQRRRFELETLVELDVALTSLGRNVAKVHLEDAKAARETGTYAGHRLPQEFDGEGEMLLRQRISHLSHRVMNDAIRAALQELRDSYSAAAVNLRITPAEGDAQFARLVSGIAVCQELIAEDIRSIHGQVPRGPEVGANAGAPESSPAPKR